MSFAMSVLNTRFILVPVSAVVEGIPVSPAADVVQFAFKAAGAEPASGDWNQGSWWPAANSDGTWMAQSPLIGPGHLALGIGIYVIHVKIYDNPEIPVLRPGELEITP